MLTITNNLFHYLCCIRTQRSYNSHGYIITATNNSLNKITQFLFITNKSFAIQGEHNVRITLSLSNMRNKSIYLVG